MRSKRYEMNQTKFLTDEEQRHLRKELNLDNRNELFITLALETGARQSELLAITPIDIDQENQTIHIIGLKGSNNRTMPVRKELIRSLIKRIKDNNIKNSQSIFPISPKTLYQIWTNYRPRSKKPFHSLRHTFAINLYKRTKDIMLIKTALGHRSIKNTMVYADYVYSTNELRRIL